MIERCPWSDSDQLYRDYHDLEWGSPVHDETKHFEFLLLETMQAGLSWRLLLGRREDYRREFAGFDWQAVSRFGPERIEELMVAPGLIHNRAKLLAAVRNAAAFERVRQEHGSFDRYIWSFTGGVPLVNRHAMGDAIPTTSQLSDTVSADLKKRGFGFVGSVTIYSHLQAIGVINDHLVDCPRWQAVQVASLDAARAANGSLANPG
jgi:DNA-3-methyladenine glycosylase I